MKTENKKISTFEIQGSFILYHKKKTLIIECLTDVVIKNNIFGKFKLLKDNFYDFNPPYLKKDIKYSDFKFILFMILDQKEAFRFFCRK